MSTILKLASRNLNRQKKRTLLLGGAIAFGIMVVTVINGFAGAFQANVAGNMAQLYAGHVFVEGAEKTPKGKAISIIRDEAPIEAALADLGLGGEGAARRSAGEVILSFEGKKARQRVYGADLGKERYLRDRLVLKSGSWDRMADPRSVILSEGVAKKLKVEIGDRITAQLKTVTGQNNVGEFVLAGVSQDMGFFSSMLAYAHREYFNELLDLKPGEFQVYGILVPKLSQAEAVSVKLQQALKKRANVFELSGEDKEKAAAGGFGTSRYQLLLKEAKDQAWTGAKYRVFTINDMISQVEEIVKVIDLVALVILVVLFVIIMVGISNTFRMIMFERVKEIGTMRAVGAQRGNVARLFLAEAGLLAAAGTVAGWLLAAAAMGGLSLIGFGTDGFFSLLLKNGHLSFAPSPAGMALDFVLVLALTLLAAALPARKAARLEPAAALRSSL